MCPSVIFVAYCAWGLSLEHSGTDACVPVGRTEGIFLWHEI